jgi:hypothetical protein
MPRALYLAKEAGIEAMGLTADLQPWGLEGKKSDIREVLSRAKAIADVVLNAPAMAGRESRSLATVASAGDPHLLQAPPGRFARALTIQTKARVAELSRPGS